MGMKKAVKRRDRRKAKQTGWRREPRVMKHGVAGHGVGIASTSIGKSPPREPDALREHVNRYTQPTDPPGQTKTSERLENILRAKGKSLYDHEDRDPEGEEEDPNRWHDA